MCEKVIEERVCKSLGSHGQRYYLKSPNRDELTKWCEICDGLVTTWYYNEFIFETKEPEYKICHKPKYEVLYQWEKMELPKFHMGGFVFPPSEPLIYEGENTIPNISDISAIDINILTPTQYDDGETKAVEDYIKEDLFRMMGELGDKTTKKIRDLEGE